MPITGFLMDTARQGIYPRLAQASMVARHGGVLSPRPFTLSHQYMHEHHGNGYRAVFHPGDTPTICSVQTVSKGLTASTALKEFDAQLLQGSTTPT